MWMGQIRGRRRHDALCALCSILFWQVAFWGGLFLIGALSPPWRDGVARNLPLVVIVASATLAVVAIGLLPLTRFDRRQWAGAALLLLIAADAAFTAYSGQSAAIWRYAVQYLAIGSVAAFVAELAGRGRAAISLLGIPCAVTLAVLIAADRFGQLPEVVRWLDTASVAAVSLYIVHALVGLAATQRDMARRVGAILLLGIATMVHDVGVNLDVFPARVLQATTLYPLYLICAVAFELAQYGFSIQQRAQTFNTTLQSVISLQESELSDAAVKLREQEKLVAVSLERQRLVRDMHDGAGGLLTRLLLRLRNGPVPQDEIHEEVQAAVDDLRQIIDSMDCAEEGLDIALAIFRERMAPRLASEGMSLRWTDQAPRPLPDLGSQRMVQIYRILQEGITNSLRHSRATTIHMRLAALDDSRCLTLSMMDDGIGFLLEDEASRPRWHRGLTNMSRRARMIGGSLTIVTKTGQGTRLELLLPATAPYSQDG